MPPAPVPEHPPLFRRHVRRPRLTRIIDESVAQSVILHAPAGYGKTTLALEWSQGKDTVVWYRAAPASSDIAAFSAGVADAVLPLFPGTGERLKQRLRVAEAPEREARLLAELLAQDVRDWANGSWFVIDDYHLVTGSAGEEFLDWLLTLTTMRFLILTRRRPAWCTARRLLHGELTVIRRDQLALNSREARAVLQGFNPERLPPFLSAAEGWPVLIGLAALSASEELPKERVSETLFEYFAEEVLQSQPEEVQDFMLLASIPATLTSERARTLLGLSDPDPIIDRLASEGLLEKAGDDEQLFHPLLREFLRSKLRNYDPNLALDLAVKALDAADVAEHWDQAFELAMSIPDRARAAEIIGKASRSLLASGRLGTLELWLRDAGSAAAEEPGALVAQASLLLRRSDFAASAAIARDLSERLPPDDPWAAQANQIIGQAKYLLSEYDTAFHFHSQAFKLAQSQQLAKDALWGMFVTSCEREDGAADGLLGQLALGGPLTLDDRLRLATGRITAAYHTDTFAGVWEAVEPLLGQARLCFNPWVRSSFTALASYACSARANYQQARELATDAVSYSRELGITFAVAFSLGYLATAEIGLRQFESARSAISALSELRSESGDPLLLPQLVTLEARLLVSLHDLPSAVAQGEACRPELLPRTQRGELLGLMALAAAGLGDVDRSFAYARDAVQLTNCLEANFSSAFSLAIIALRDGGDHPSSRLRGVLDRALTAEFPDALVVAYRAYPPLLEAIASWPESRSDVARIMECAQDHGLGTKFGFLTSRAVEGQAPPEALTPREWEILALLATGLSNRDIANRLFISISTVKAHIIHIFRKLGVNSRVQAVVKYRQLTEGSATQVSQHGS
jgi:ATP/maltotriose-dependent transcriptional regulator MalT